MEKMLKLGPKEMKGLIWDDGGKSKVVQILISYGKHTVYSLQFVYDVNGKMVPSEIHGKPRGSKFDIVTFDDPEEYLTSISGQYGKNKLVSIKFGTTKLGTTTFGAWYPSYGPFGTVVKSSVVKSSFPHFEYKFRPKHSFGGFHGSLYKSCLSSIGVYVTPLGSIAETETETNIGIDKK